jgi:hypothetical protein
MLKRVKPSRAESASLQYTFLKPPLPEDEAVKFLRNKEERGMPYPRFNEARITEIIDAANAAVNQKINALKTSQRTQRANEARFGEIHTRDLDELAKSYLEFRLIETRNQGKDPIARYSAKDELEAIEGMIEGLNSSGIIGTRKNVNRGARNLEAEFARTICSMIDQEIDKTIGKGRG